MGSPHRVLPRKKFLRQRAPQWDCEKRTAKDTRTVPAPRPGTAPPYLRITLAGEQSASQGKNIVVVHGVERNFNSGHDNHNEKLDTWLKEPGREHLIITRGSDCHEIPQVGLVDFVIDEDVKNSTELAQVLKKLV